jgi:DNA-binding Xre family transcriptional regulator
MSEKMLIKVINSTPNPYSIMLNTMEYKKISWQKLADWLGVSRMGLYKSFQNQTLTISAMLAICEKLELNPVELFENDAFIAAEPPAEYKTTTPAQAIIDRLKKVHHLCTEIENIALNGKGAN